MEPSPVSITQPPPNPVATKPHTTHILVTDVKPTTTTITNPKQKASMETYPATLSDSHILLAHCLFMFLMFSPIILCFYFFFFYLD